MRTKISAALFPIITLVVQDPTVDELDEMFNELTKLLEKRPGKHVTLTDSTAMRTMPDAKVRRFIADRQGAHNEKYGARGMGAVIILDSALVRGALTAINWIRPLADRQEYVATRLEGMQVCVRWMEAEGLPVTEPLRTYLRTLERDARAAFP